ncbi:hypothetical protein BBJ28_00002886 [Nothophytophthora sp. Chile5]|nr:hypothetical protein BBJ28_00002886 [Nothophytophthora sp. Chile5]
MTASSDTAALSWPPARSAAVEELPGVVLLQVLTFLDHSALHAAEKTARTFYDLVRQHRTSPLAVLIGPLSLCLNAGTNGGIVCIRQLRTSDAMQDVSPMGLTLGECIQHRCGCSTGHSCYWSSSASTDKNASDFIDYTLNGPCVVSSVQIVPYRVFWHPGSPTYAPQRVQFELFDVTLGDTAAGGARHRSPLLQQPIYVSPSYDVKNDMTLQEFSLPRKVAVSKTTILRVKLLGRHQAQTFELPLTQQHTAEDTLPKYYCCLSYVNVCGLPWKPAGHKSEGLAVEATKLSAMSPSVRMAAALAEYMTACYEGFLGRTRRWQ